MALDFVYILKQYRINIDLTSFRTKEIVDTEITQES